MYRALAMPRPKTVDDDAVLDAALAVVGRVGPGGLTLSAVGDEVGLSAATLVQRFGSKRDLLLAVAARGADRGGEALRESARRHRSPLRALVVGLGTMTAGVETPEAFANHLAFLQTDLADPAFHEHALRHARGMRDEIAALLEAAVEAGEIAPCDVRRLASAVQSAYNGAMITWAVHRRGRLETWVRREVETLLDPRRVR